MAEVEFKPVTLKMPTIFFYLCCPQVKNYDVSIKTDMQKETEIKLPTSAGSWKKQEFQKNIHFCFLDYAKAFDSVDHNKLWKILKEMGIPDHLTCLLRNLYAGQ